MFSLSFARPGIWGNEGNRCSIPFAKVKSVWLISELRCSDMIEHALCRIPWWPCRCLWARPSKGCWSLKLQWFVSCLELAKMILRSHWNNNIYYDLYKEKRLRDAHARLKKRGVPLAANQVNYSLIYRTPELNGVKAACDELGITLIAYSPIAQGGRQTLNLLPNYVFV